MGLITWLVWLVVVVAILWIIDKLTDKKSQTQSYSSQPSSGGLASKLKGVVSACCNKLAGKTYGV